MLQCSLWDAEHHLAGIIRWFSNDFKQQLRDRGRQRAINLLVSYAASEAGTINGVQESAAAINGVLKAANAGDAAAAAGAGAERATEGGVVKVSPSANARTLFEVPDGSAIGALYELRRWNDVRLLTHLRLGGGPGAMFADAGARRTTWKFFEYQVVPQQHSDFVYVQVHVSRRDAQKLLTHRRPHLKQHSSLLASVFDAEDDNDVGTASEGEGGGGGKPKPDEEQHESEWTPDTHEYLDHPFIALARVEEPVAIFEARLRTSLHLTVRLSARHAFSLHSLAFSLSPCLCAFHPAHAQLHPRSPTLALPCTLAHATSPRGRPRRLRFNTHAVLFASHTHNHRHRACRRRNGQMASGAFSTRSVRAGSVSRRRSTVLWVIFSTPLPLAPRTGPSRPWSSATAPPPHASDSRRPPLAAVAFQSDSAAGARASER